jgi:hypothetical protein
MFVTQFREEKMVKNTLKDHWHWSLKIITTDVSVRNNDAILWILNKLDVISAFMPSLSTMARSLIYYRGLGTQYAVRRLMLTWKGVTVAVDRPNYVTFMDTD